MIAKSIPSRIKTLGLPLGLAGAATIALAAGASFSGSVVAKPSPDMTAAEAQKALKSGKIEKAIQLGESVVAANPNEPTYRALLGQTYLKAGRFESASAAFNDAMKLGDSTARTALGLALSNSAQGRTREAVAILDDWRDAIPAADLGLALALAGETSRGVAILADALRSGENTPKLRQNLAYAYALDGRWREARVMAEQDVPADQLDARISEWAARAKPEDHQIRIAGLLSVPVRADPGQPRALALGNDQGREQLAIETAATKAAPQLAAKDELPPAAEAPAALAQYRPVDAPVEAPVAYDNPYAANAAGTPVVQPLPQNYAAAQPAPDAAARPAQAAKKPSGLAVRKTGLRPRQGAAKTKYGFGSSHNVQLGSFLSQQGARRAWGIYAARNPELKGYRMTITQAQVRGRTYFRVAAAGFNGKGASGLCSTVKSRGMACFAYALPGKATKAPAYAQSAKPAVKVAIKAAAPTVAIKASPAGPSNARGR